MTTEENLAKALSLLDSFMKTVQNGDKLTNARIEVLESRIAVLERRLAPMDTRLKSKGATEDEGIQPGRGY